MSDAYPEFEPQKGDKPIAYVLVGLPGSGKSHWARRHPKNLPIASTDSYIEKYSKEKKLSYAEAFKACYSEARADMKAQISKLTKMGQSFIWDQVNLTRKERLSIHNRLDPTHRVVYVCFLVPLSECIRRHEARAREGGAVVDAERIKMLSRTTIFPQPGTEPFYRLITLTHSEWGKQR